MNTQEQQLLKDTIGLDTVRMQVRTGTCIDVGLWWRQRPLWLCVTERVLVVFAIARRRHVEQVPLASCQDIHYSPQGGELVIPSQPALRFPRLKMPASTALEVIDLVKNTTQAAAATTEN